MGDIETNKEFKKLVQDVIEIKEYLLGTKYVKKGLVNRVDSLERDMVDIHKIKGRFFAYAAGAGSVVTAFLLGLKLLIFG